MFGFERPGGVPCLRSGLSALKSSVFAVAHRSGVLSGLEDYGLSIKAYVSSNHEWLPAAVFGVFTVMNTLRILAYVPQMLKAAQDANGASAISYATWTLFLISHLTTIAYALVGPGDLVMALVFAANALACLAIISITWVNRRQFSVRLAQDSKIADWSPECATLRASARADATPFPCTVRAGSRRFRCRNAPYVRGRRRFPLLPLGRITISAANKSPRCERLEVERLSEGDRMKLIGDSYRCAGSGVFIHRRGATADCHQVQPRRVAGLA